MQLDLCGSSKCYYQTFALFEEKHNFNNNMMKITQTICHGLYWPWRPQDTLIC